MTASGNHPTVLVLDNDEAVLSNCERILSTGGYRVVTFDDGCAELNTVMEVKPEAAIAILRRPCDECLRLIHEIRRCDRHIAIIVIAESPTIRNAVDALKAGADEILPEPFSSDELILTVAVALKQRRDGSC